jgi:hypothetical protein
VWKTASSSLERRPFVSIQGEEASSRPGESLSARMVAVRMSIRVITKLPKSEQSYKGKVKTHNQINRQNQSTTGKL